MRKRGAAIIQRNSGWCGVTLSARDGKIADFEGPGERRPFRAPGRVAEEGYGIAVDNGSGYLFTLTFPFTDRRRIRTGHRRRAGGEAPVSVEDLAIDFMEAAKGTVLAAAVPRALTDTIAQDKHVRITTMQAIAVLHALRWLNVVYHGDFVFLHQNGSTMVVMAFKADRLCYLRQFFHTSQSDALDEAFREIAEDKT